MKKIIGIAGGTASGKSTFTDKLAEKLESDGLSVRTIHMDSFFRPEEERPHVASHLSGKVYVDDNCPDTVDLDSFRAEFFAAAADEKTDVVIAEGLLVLWDETIKDRLDLRVFVECAADERIVRRLRRNMEWGLSFDKISAVYLDMVRFRHEQYVEPTKWTADIIVNGAGDTEKATEMIAGWIGKE